MPFNINIHKVMVLALCVGFACYSGAAEKVILNKENITPGKLIDRINDYVNDWKSSSYLSKGKVNEPIAGEAFADVLAKGLKLSDRENFRFDKESFGKQSVYRRFQQTYKGVPIENGFVVVKSDKEGTIRNLYGNYYINIGGNVAVPVTFIEMKAQELEALVKNEYLDKIESSDSWTIERLVTTPVVLVDEEGKARYSHKITFFAINRNSQTPLRPVIYYDPVSEKIIMSYNHLAHYRAAGSGVGGNEKTGEYHYEYVGELNTDGILQTFVIDKSFGQKKCRMNADNVVTIDYENNVSSGPEDAYVYACDSIGENNSDDSVLNDAHYHAQITSQMYRQYLGITPLVEKDIKQRVHYGQNYDNAFWDGEYAVYGDGGNRVYPMVVQDVVAHEITHGFIEYHVDLGIQGPAGAVNESLADIAGEAAEYFSDPNSQKRWEHNYDAYREEGALRYFARPSDDGNSIDTALFYSDDMDPHHASGVFNRAFYSLVDPEELYPQSLNWTLPVAFKLFAMAVKNHCLAAGMNFDQAAQCVVSQAEEVAESFNTACVDSPAGDGCRYTIFEIQRDIKKAFAVVDVNVDIEDDYRLGTVADFQYIQRLTDITFNNDSSSLAGIVQTTWDFGDGNSAVTEGLEGVEHSYTDPGRYRVSITVKGTDGHTDVMVREVYVNSDYCEASGQSSSKRWISSVNVKGISRESSKDGYGDFTDTLFSVGENISVPLALTAGHDSSVQGDSVYWAIWIDANGNGRFSNDELVFEAAGSGTVTGEFTPPLLTHVGPTRMRVIMRWIARPVSACGSVGTGEVEDYSVMAGSQSNQLNFDYTVTGLSVSFNNTSAVENGAAWQWDFGDGNSSETKSPTHTYSSGGNYNVTLSATLPSGDEVEPLSRSITVSADTTNYCEAGSTATGFEVIQRVQLSNVDRDSGSTSSGYEHYTNEIIELTAGETYSYTFTPWYSNAEYNSKYWRAWIDFNGNKQFEDSEEYIRTSARIATNRLEGNFPVPSTASGTTRMRIIMRHELPPDACGIFGGFYDGGEVEDYDIRITN